MKATMKILKSKKAVMLLAMLLMVSLVVGMGAMTYSRYVTEKKMDTPAQATVAQWGYVINFNANNMFGKKYEGNVITSNDNVPGDGVDVMTKGSSDIVAPGSSGSMTVTIDGVAEVLAAFSIAFDDANTNNIFLEVTKDATNVTYNPIKWSLTKGTEDVVTYQSFDDLKDDLADESMTIQVGQNLNNVVYTISWSWALDFDSNTDSTEYDIYDSMLGLLSAGKTVDEVEAMYTGYEIVGSNTTLAISLSAKVEQIQD